MRSNVNINGTQLTGTQIQCLREVMLINFISNSDILRIPDGGDMTVFYRYREFAHTWLDILDNNPAVKILAHAGSGGMPGGMTEDEPVVLVDGVRMDFLLSMQVRMAVSSIGFHEQEIDQASAKDIPMGELGSLQNIIFSKKAA